MQSRGSKRANHGLFVQHQSSERKTNDYATQFGSINYYIVSDIVGPQVRANWEHPSII